MSYWGYKFEGLSTVSRPPSQLLPDDPILQARRFEVVNTNVEYGIVVRTRLGKNTLILGAEVDCISGEGFFIFFFFFSSHFFSSFHFFIFLRSLKCNTECE